ncbi:MAG: hypothetical protein ETSY1_08700 [Candidatus Entotheonella factor]|uniref:Calcium-binding protein n=1 Tax=Entotheonella factor TaxID=1429438 RepID=W4LTQ0_ENTF1|nr:MAG: hypothetical protein ETSY1_08700 [Candidatus Entotheonella factor]
MAIVWWWVPFLLTIPTGPLVDTGVAYVYERQGNGRWLEAAILTASDGDVNDNFGTSVSISGERVVVGAPGDDDRGLNSGSAYSYERGDGRWLQTAKVRIFDGSPFDNFGISVSVSGDRLLIGSFADDDNGTNSGSAYVFRYQSRSAIWFQIGKLTAPDGDFGDTFGIGVALNGDRMVIGAVADEDNGPSSGSAYVFEFPIPRPPCDCRNATIVGTGGNDVLVGTNENDIICGFGGDDRLLGNGGNDCLDGGSGNDQLFGNSGDDEMRGRSGDDVLRGGDGDDIMRGDGDDDVLRGDDGNDLMLGGTGDDIMIGGEGNDEMEGGRDNDVLRGDNGDDTLHGNGGDDTLRGGRGRDTVRGGSGNDDVRGGADSDFVRGDDGNDVVRGNGGRDNVQGNAGDDDLSGGSGDDLLNGGSDNDICHGNSGVDTAINCEETVSIP